MQLAYEVKLTDYKAALKLHTRRSALRLIGRTIRFVILPIFILFLAISLIVSVFEEPTIHTFDFIAPSLMLLVLIAIPILHTFTIRKQFNLLFPLSRIDRNVSLDINEERIISAFPQASEGKYFWNAISEVAQNDEITLFYLAKNRFFFVPTRTFSAAQRAEPNDLVARHTVKR